MPDAVMRGLPTPQFFLDYSEDEVPSLGDLPGARVYRATNQSIPSASTTSVIYTDVETDTHGYFNSSHPTRLTVPVGMGGWHLVHAAGVFDITHVIQRHFQAIDRNGSGEYTTRSGIGAASGIFGSISFPTTLVRWLNAGDYVEHRVYQSSSGAQDFGGGGTGTKPTFTIVKLSGLRGERGPRGLAGYDVATSFPASPYDQQEIFRSDIRRGMLFYWDEAAGYWLSRENQFESTQHLNAHDTSLAVNGRFALPEDLDIYLTRIEVSAFVSTTNNASNYWYLRTNYTRSAADGNNVTVTNLPNSSTVGISWSQQWPSWDTGYLIPSATTAISIEPQFGKTGTPGLLYAQGRYTWKLRAT